MTGAVYFSFLPVIEQQALLFFSSLPVIERQALFFYFLLTHNVPAVIHSIVAASI